MKRFTRILTLLLAVIMVACMFAACGETKPETPDTGKDTAKDTGKDTSTDTQSVEPSKNDTTPLVVGYSPFSNKFSPFFSETAYDQDVWSMTALGLLTSDRQGAMIMKGIEGETKPYNGTDYTYYGPADCTITENEDGTVTYDFKLREDLKFSDGEPITIDDVIFSMYVLSDPTYDGSSTLFAVPIVGMDEYRSGMESRMALILKAGEGAYAANDYYTEEQYNAFWEAFNAAGIDFVLGIKDALVNVYAMNTEEDTVATWAANWGFEVAEDATEADVWATIVKKYGYDLSDNGINSEVGTSDSITTLILAKLGDAASDYQAGVQTGESAANISGIVKTGDYSMTVTTSKVDATAIYQLSLAISPLHYYGDKAAYDYANNKFGFTKGDLSIVRAKTTQPLGAGPYKFIKFENGVVNFEANENYFKGAPKIKYINFLECLNDNDKLSGVVTGSIDITDPSFSTNNIAAIEEANGGELIGDVITTNTVDNLGYGYIGQNAKVQKVGDDPGSEASKNLRRAYATVMAVYRDVAIDSYYGDRASVINYPISNTSWAAPQSSDDGYQVAFSVDVDGNPIYTSDMTAEQKYEAAKKAALGFFEAAGFTVENGKVTKAPEGASLEVEAWIPADGTGDHPAFMIFDEARKAFEEIGITFKIKDLTNSSELWTALSAQSVAIWAAAWGATVDPDMYQIYFSGDDEGHAAGGSNYQYAIDDQDLNKMILEARESTDQTYRKTMYKACLDKIIEWAVELPTYQRQNAIIFSTQRVNIDTITPDITTFYGWMSEIENTELK